MGPEAFNARKQVQLLLPLHSKAGASLIFQLCAYSRE
jgi:hypothetical protein